MLRYTLLIALIGLGACSTTGNSRSDEIAEILSDPRVGEEVDSICFTRGIDGFSDATENSVVLRRGVKDEYLVATKFCPDLRFAQRLVLDQASSCLRRLDDFRIFGNAMTLTRPEESGFNRCVVDAIYKWDDEAVEPSEEDVNEALED